MKIQLILISILLFFSIGLCGQIDNTIDKGTGILYFSGIPGTTPDTTASSYEAEIAFNTINGEMFFYDRDSTSWKRLTGIEKGFGDPTADPGIYAKSYVNLTDGSFWRWNGAIWVNAFASGGGGISDGDKGDITVSGSGTVWTIDNEAVTTEKLESGESSPIANQFYGTNNIGTKGFHSIDTINTIGKVYRTASDSMFLQAPTVWISNNTQEVLSIDTDGVKILNGAQDNGATVLYGKDPLSSEIVEVNDLTGFNGVDGSLSTTDQPLTAPRSITATNTNTLTLGTDSDGSADFIITDAIKVHGNKIMSGNGGVTNSQVWGTDATYPLGNESGNVVIGDSAFHNVQVNTLVKDNVVVGAYAGVENTVGRYLTLVGAWAGHDNRTGLDNTAFGQLSLQYNQDGNFNTAFGYGAGRRFRADSTGGKGLSSENIFFGWGTGYGPITGPFNTGYRNLFVGYQTGFHWQTGNDNTLIGHRSGENGNGADWNVSVGARSLLRLTTGDYNIGLGGFALQNIDVGIRNIGIGYNSGYNNSNGSDNIVIGNNMATSSASASNEVILGFNGTEKLTYNKATNNIWEFQGGVDITSTTQGFKMPSMTTAQRDLISTPSTGLQIYNTEDSSQNYYNGDRWINKSENLDVRAATTEILEAGSYHYTGATPALISFTGTGEWLISTSSSVGTFSLNENSNTIINVKTGVSGSITATSGSTFRVISDDGSNYYASIIDNSSVTPNAYGEMYVADNDPDTVTITSGTPIEFTDWTAGGLENFTYSAGRLTYTGTATIECEVSIGLSFEFSVGNSVLDFALYKNGVELPNVKLYRKVGSGGDIESSSRTGLVSLATNDYIELFSDSDANGQMIVTTANVFAAKIE